MYQAIVFLPLLGFLLAGIASLLTHKFGRDVAAWGAADHSAHYHHGQGRTGTMPTVMTPTATTTIMPSSRRRTARASSASRRS